MRNESAMQVLQLAFVLEERRRRKKPRRPFQVCSKSFAISLKNAITIWQREITFAIWQPGRERTSCSGHHRLNIEDACQARRCLPMLELTTTLYCQMIHIENERTLIRRRSDDAREIISQALQIAKRIRRRHRHSVPAFRLNLQ
jgi:hypothetical protein